MKKFFGMLLIRIGDKLISWGFDWWTESSTEEEQAAFINERIKPLGILLTKLDPYIGEYGRTTQLETVLIRISNEAGGGYDN